MNPVILFIVLLLTAAAGMLYLSDRGLVRLTGIATLMISAPAILLTAVLDWRVEVGQAPTVLGFALLAIGGVGTIFLAAALLNSVFRLVFPKKLAVVSACAVKPSVTISKKTASAGKNALDNKAV